MGVLEASKQKSSWSSPLNETWVLWCCYDSFSKHPAFAAWGQPCSWKPLCLNLQWTFPWMLWCVPFSSSPSQEFHPYSQELSCFFEWRAAFVKWHDVEHEKWVPNLPWMSSNALVALTWSKSTVNCEWSPFWETLLCFFDDAMGCTCWYSKILQDALRAPPFLHPVSQQVFMWSLTRAHFLGLFCYDFSFQLAMSIQSVKRIIKQQTIHTYSQSVLC